MKTLDDLKAELLQRLDIRAAYDALDDEFSLAEVLIRARIGAEMTQAQLAEKMSTSQSSIAKLEWGRVIPSTRAL
ncbi:MAG: XRE family transcriptional regulator [Alphaproteobacteria bacterium]|nr:MAG: XRE family transcriptional regulator [Alphaproteobacteria bacterium]